MIPKDFYNYVRHQLRNFTKNSKIIDFFTSLPKKDAQCLTAIYRGLNKEFPKDAALDVAVSHLSTMDRKLAFRDLWENEDHLDIIVVADFFCKVVVESLNY